MAQKTRKVIKTGNSLALTIPSRIIKQFNLSEGDLAQIKIDHAHTSIKYVFSGHPKQLTLINKKNGQKTT